MNRHTKTNTHMYSYIIIHIILVKSKKKKKSLYRVTSYSKRHCGINILKGLFKNLGIKAVQNRQ